MFHRVTKIILPIPITALLALMLLWTATPAAWGQTSARPPRDAAELMRMMDELWRGKTSQAKLSMTVKTLRYQRSMTLEAWSEGKDKSLIQILAPKKDRGIATLKVGKNIWNYLPKVNRVTKIPASMMMGSWMGSHFTNDDLVKESSFEDDYVSTLSFTGERNGQNIYEVTSIPRPEAAVVWSKLVTEIAQQTLLPVRTLYFDDEDKLAREMRFLEPKKFGGRTVPSVMRLTEAEKPDEFTTVTYEELAYDITLAGDQFSLSRLKKR